MLVLSRNVSEKIQVDGPCVITVVRIHEDRVKLGVDAAKDVNIVRTELLAHVPGEVKEERGENRTTSYTRTHSSPASRQASPTK